jgi:hypothetical protein
MKDYGVWWNIAGAGWVSCFPEHHHQVEMFGGCSKHVPGWGGKPLSLTKEEAEELAADWSKRESGPYVALPLVSVLPKGELTFTSPWLNSPVSF